MPCRSRNCWLNKMCRPFTLCEGFPMSRKIRGPANSEMWRAAPRKAGPQSMVLLLLLFLNVVCVSGCGRASEQSTDPVSKRVIIAVTSYPLLAITEHIAGATAKVELVISSGFTSPEWKPDSNAIQKLQQATRILISGGDYEPWLHRVTVPRSRLIDTAQGYYNQLVRISDAVIHQHGPDGGHSHPGVVWATWMDPHLLTSQLDQTRDVLLEVLPDSEAVIRKSADGLAEEFRKLDKRLEEIAADTSGVDISVLGDAPVYQYLTQRLGWELNYVHLPARGPLSDENLGSLQRAIAEHQPSMVFVRRTLAAELDQLRRDIAAAPLIVIDLCETDDGKHTLTQRMALNLEAIQGGVDH